MNRYPIQSKNIVSVDYDEINEILEIEFKLHVIYQYLEVPLDEFVDFMKAENTEEFYDNFIKSKYHFNLL